jgi:hypothetical protein
MPVGGINPNAWNNWYHAVGSTYGTWLRGNPRGFRTFQHRQHVEGDYRNAPAPGVWEPVFERSKKTLRYPVLNLDMNQRRVICSAMVDKLQSDHVEVVVIAIVMNHFHVLARFPGLAAKQIQTHGASILKDGRDPAPRHFLGRARRHASFELSAAGMKPVSPVWASRPKCEPIENRRRQVNTARYIEQHVEQGTAVWVVTRGFLFEL